MMMFAARYRRFRAARNERGTSRYSSTVRIGVGPRLDNKPALPRWSCDVSS